MTSAFSMGGPWARPDDFHRRLRHAGALMAAVWDDARRAYQGSEHERHTHHAHHEHDPHEQGEHGPREHRFRGPRGPRPFAWDFGRGPFGPGFPFGGGRPGFGRGRKAKRGDVRAAILALLAEEPRNGYQIIQEIAVRSQGGWKPSPGAVYPALQQLTDEGLVRADETEGRKTFQLTEAGRAYVTEHQDEVRAPWEEMTPQVDDNSWEIIDLGRQTAAALFQVMQTGTDAQVAQAKQILIESRRKLYQVLADGDPSEE